MGGGGGTKVIVTSKMILAEERETTATHIQSLVYCSFFKKDWQRW
jgi:hypothetical protein